MATIGVDEEYLLSSTHNQMQKSYWGVYVHVMLNKHYSLFDTSSSLWNLMQLLTIDAMLFTIKDIE